jgi:hypothetical protein
MTTCHLCGIELNEEDDVVVVDDNHSVHVSCASAPSGTGRRQVRPWAALGSRQQMAMGDVQRDTPP